MPTHIPIKDESEDQHLVIRRSRTKGKTFEIFTDFVARTQRGERVQLEGVGYVAMSRVMYDELMKKAHPLRVVVDESAGLGHGSDMWPEVKR